MLDTVTNPIDESSFGGNPLLKPAFCQIELTLEQLEEYARCEEDPIYFIKNYVKIISLDHGVVPFDLWGFQEHKMVPAMINNRFVCCLTPRQVGKTTTAAAVILWHVLFNAEYKVAVLANKQDQATEIVERIQMAYENLPKWMQQGVVAWNKRSFTLENGSKVISAGTSSSAIRGKSINLLYLDEFAHIDRNLQKKFFTSTYPVISSGKDTKVIITTTPNGFELFAKIWHDAKKGKNSYLPVEVHWSEVPGRDEKWKEETIANTSKEQFRQEHENEFIGSSDTLLDADTLNSLFYSTPLRMNNNIAVFEDPIPGHTYFMTVDVARGGGGDYSAFVVVDVTNFPYKVVATYRDNTVMPAVLPTFVHHASLIYNNAYILVEVNDAGGQVADILHMELENENLVMVSQTGRKGQMLGGQGGVKPRFGVKTTNPVKRIGCASLKGLMEHRKLVVNDANIVDEFYTFVFDGTNYAAEAGRHDDLVMCLVLFAWASTQQYFKDLLDSDVRARILHDIERAIEDDMTPFGFIDDGHEDEEVYVPPQTISWFDQQLR